MLFNSIDFLIFFPIVLLAYFVLPAKIRYIWLLISSYFFYICWNPVYIILIIISTIITYLCGRIVGYIKEKKEIEAIRQKHLIQGVMAISFTVNLGLLVYFKYTNFLVDTVNAFLQIISVNPVRSYDILLPVGISFYTFQALGYTVDVYRGNVKAEKNIFKYALFVSFFLSTTCSRSY